jgi:predicted amidohydrolase YtcJ
MNARHAACLVAALLVSTTSCRKKAEAPAEQEAQVEKRICADDIYTGATVYTVDASFGAAGAFSVRDGRFLEVGTEEKVLEGRCSSTRLHDLGGMTILPGLIDSHAHLLSLGLMDAQIDLVGVASAREAAARVAEAVADAPAGGWIQGRGWDQTLWEGSAFPDRTLLDGAAPDNPVLLRRVDGHAAWVNSKALAAASIDRGTPDPDGGRILRDGKGEPTGILIDNAADAVRNIVPEPSRPEKKEAVRRAIARCLGEGLTMVHDAGIDGETLAIYRELVEEGDFPFRVYAMIEYTSDDSDDLLLEGPIVAWKDRIWLRAVKFYADGALGSRGAALLEPYSDAPETSGLLVTPEDELASGMERVAGMGFQPAVHAIGDRANRIVIDIYEKILVRHPNCRPRIEHAQVLAPGDAARIGKLGIIAAMQPTHCTSDMRWAGDRLGPERVRGAYAWRDVMEAGALLSSGSDFPVEPSNPFYGLHAAVTRQDRSGRQFDGETMSLEEAIRSFTIACARASYTEELLGSIEPGKHADFIVLGKDPFGIAPEKLHALEVLRTFVGGKEVYTRP